MVQQKTTEKLTAKAVGREFVRQYYTMLAKEPRFLHRFYGSSSEMMHGNKDAQFPAVGQVKIREEIKSLNFKDCHTKVAQLDAFLTIGNGICIQVAGEISNNQEPLRRFMQTFVLGPQERDGAEPGTSFYVHNDIFRYQDDIFDDPPTEPVETHNVEEQTVPQDNGDHANYYEQLEPQVEVPISEVQQETVSEPEQVLAQEEPVQEEEKTNPVEVEPTEESAAEEEPEPTVSEEPVRVPSEPESVSEVTEQLEKISVSSQPSQSSAPLSWAARMRSGTGPMPPTAPPAQPVVPQPVAKVTKPLPAVEVNGSVSEDSSLNQAPPPQRENNRNQENRGYNRENRHFDNDRPRREYNDDKQQIFVGGLPNSMQEADLREVFSKYGNIKHVRLNVSNSNRPGAGFGFVTFSNEQGAREALSNKDTIYFNKLQLNIEEKKTKPFQDRRQGGGQMGNYQQNGGFKVRDGNNRSRDQRDGGYSRDGQGRMGPGGRGGDNRRDNHRGRNPKF